MHDELAAMGIEIDTENNEEQITYTLNNNELEEILENSESEENETLIIDSNIDAHRINDGSIPGKCIVDLMYHFEQLHEKFDNHCRGIECSFRDLTFIGAVTHGLKNRL
ncbi:unnamed protein product, partial [Lasius platythorax]